MEVRQYQIYWTKLDPTIGSEIRKVRPCLVISPNEMNRYLSTVLIAPLTTKSKQYPTRVKTSILDKSSWIILDQLRSIDKIRLYKFISLLDPLAIREVKQTLKAMLVDT